MNAKDLTPNHRILIVDDNPSIHADFREILCPVTKIAAAVDAMEAALFGDAKPVASGTSFELDSAYQGQEGLAMVKAGARGTAALCHGVCGRADAARLGRH